MIWPAPWSSPFGKVEAVVMRCSGCRLFLGIGSDAFEESFGGRYERWQIFGQGGLHDVVGGVEISVREMVAHPGEVDPWDGGFFG
jgi:hypothetical protein